MSQPNSYNEALNRIKQKGFDVPVRQHTAESSAEAGTEWRTRGPITNEWYGPMNLAYLLGKSKIHAKGSVAEEIETLFKTWEMEVTNKKNIEDWKSVDQLKYKVTVGHVDYKQDPDNVDWQKPVAGKDAAALGNYNIMLQKCPAYKYRDVTPEDAHFEDSHDIFHDGFSSFPWEVLDAEKVSDSVIKFTYRHWGYWASKGQVQLVNLIGKVKVDLDPSTKKIESLEITIDPTKFLSETVEGKPKDDDTVFPSALAQALGKRDARELTDLIPKGKTLETL